MRLGARPTGSGCSWPPTSPSGRPTSCARWPRACPTPRSPPRCWLSPETVKTHVKSILGKLGVRDRTQAVVWAYRTGFAGGDTR